MKVLIYLKQLIKLKNAELKKMKVWNYIIFQKTWKDIENS